MSIPPADPAVDSPHPLIGEPRRPGGWLGIVAAWTVILIVVVLMAATRGGGGTPASPAEAMVPSDDPVAAALLTIQGRYALGVSRLASSSGGPISPDELFQQVASAVPTGPPQVRMRMAILAAELVGPDRGLRVLEELREAVTELDEDRGPTGFTLGETDQRLLAALTGHFAALAGERPGTLDADDHVLLSDELGWWGRVATVLDAPEAERAAVLSAATRAAWVVLGAFVLVGVAGLAGVALLIAAIVGVSTGRLRLAGSLDPGRRARHGVLVEVFAVWIVLFLALQIMGGLAAGAANAGPAGMLGAAFAAFMLSLVALEWRRVRGLDGAEFVALAGLGRGRGVIREIGAGFVGYAATLPLLAVGLVGTLLLALAAGLAGGAGAGTEPVEALLPSNGPAHPIVGEIGRSGLVTLMVLLTGAVAAPIVEEIFFRGCLYPHLRHGAARLGPVVAVGLGAVVSAFIFAVIHPQGLIAVPALMSLAIGFALVREWRGSVIAPVVMHAINNGAVLSLLVLLLA